MSAAEYSVAESLLAISRLVHELAEPHTIKTRILDRATGKPTDVHVGHDALIGTLRNAVFESTSGGGAAGVTESRARSVVNATALAMLDELDDNILAAWTLISPNMAELPKEWTLERALLLWLHVFLPAANAGQFDDGTVHEAAGLWRSWRHRILSMFDTPTVMSSTKPCPSCRSTWAVIGSGEEATRVRAVIVSIGRAAEYHRAECRSCGKTWVGGQQVERLAADQRDLDRDTRDLAAMYEGAEGIEPPAPKVMIDIPVPDPAH
jgi:hypothetical protein